MQAQKFYGMLLKMRGEGFFAVARKHKRQVWLVAAMLLVGGLTSYFVMKSEWGDMILALTCMGTGACAALAGGIDKRRTVWPHVDEVIDWERVAEKAGSTLETYHSDS